MDGIIDERGVIHSQVNNKLPLSIPHLSFSNPSEIELVEELVREFALCLFIFSMGNTR